MGDQFFRAVEEEVGLHFLQGPAAIVAPGNRSHRHPHLLGGFDVPGLVSDKKNLGHRNLVTFDHGPKFAGFAEQFR